MQTATTYKNLGLVMFVLACALTLVAGAGAYGQGKGKGTQNGKLWDDNQKTTKNHRDKNDREKIDRRSGDNDDQDERINGRDINGNQSVRFAYQRGYKEGFKNGKAAAKNHSSGIVYNNASFPTNGNHNGWGNNREWRRAYEDGYRRGFHEGYDRYRRPDDRRSNDRKIFGIRIPR